MRRSAARLQSPLAYAAVGASILGVPASAAAVGGGSAADGSSPAIKAKVKRSRIEYGGEVVVVGAAPAFQQGQTVALEYSPATTGGWQQIATAEVGGDGRFRLVGWPRQSGWLVVTSTAQAGAARLATPESTPSSVPERVDVTGAIHVRRRAIEELGARTVELRGMLLPAAAGRKVSLQTERAGRWVTLSVARTGPRGRFALRDRPSGLGRALLRVRFDGDGVNGAVSSQAGSVTVYQQSVASWYYDGGSTACGFHAYYGVANLSLPCGTKVSFLYGGRVVRAVVDDRGPYVGGRTWDLNQNTAAALGMGGVATVWSSQ